MVEKEEKDFPYIPSPSVKGNGIIKGFAPTLPLVEINVGHSILSYDTVVEWL